VGSSNKVSVYSVSAYGLHDGSTVAIIGGGDNSSHARRQGEKTKAPERKTEESTIAQIRAELEGVRGTLLPGVDTLLAGITRPAADGATPRSDPSPATEVPTREQEQEHVRLGELLLQSLLRLDAITAEGEWAEARKERKGAVKEVQGLLDRLDGEWKEAKART
jgi:hypothetical protein